MHEENHAFPPPIYNTFRSMNRQIGNNLESHSNSILNLINCAFYSQIIPGFQHSPSRQKQSQSKQLYSKQTRDNRD